MYNGKQKTNVLAEHKSTARRHTYRELAEKVIYYSIPITICVGAQYAGNLIDVANIRGRLAAGGYTIEMVSVMHSYLSKYQQIMNAPISIVSALAAAVLPLISAAAAEGNFKLMEEKTKQAFRLCLLIVFPSAVGLSVLSQPLYSLLKYGEGAYLMRYGSVVLILMSIVQIQSSILQGAGKMYRATTNIILGIVLKLVLNYLLISNPNINIMGVVISSIAGFGLSVVLNSITIRKQAGIKTNIINQSIRPFISSVIMGAAVWIVYGGVYRILGFMGSSYIANAVAALISVFAGMIIYFLVMLKAQGITNDDLQVLPERIKKVIPRQVLERVR
jgi:stage V sporulation protein B